MQQWIVCHSTIQENLAECNELAQYIFKSTMKFPNMKAKVMITMIYILPIHISFAKFYITMISILTIHINFICNYISWEPEGC